VKFTRRGASIVMSTIDIPGGVSYSLVAPDQKTAAAVNVALPRK